MKSFKACVALQAQHIYNRFGKSPGTVPSIFFMSIFRLIILTLSFMIISMRKEPTLKSMQGTWNAGTRICNGRVFKKIENFFLI